jgi:hypothetical protein
MLNFYVNEFDEKEYGIDLLGTNGVPIFYAKGQYVEEPSNFTKADLEIRDPICPGKNMTRNCYQYSHIKDMFRTILDRCYTRGHREGEAVASEYEGSRLSEWTSEYFSKRNVFLELHASMEMTF